MIVLTRLARCLVEKEPPLVMLATIKVEHAQEGIRELIERPVPNPASVPVVFDEAQYGALIGQIVIDEVSLGEGRDYQ